MSKPPPPDPGASTDDAADGADGFERRPTPWPSFDLEAFARDSETMLLAPAERAREIPTAPPPPFHPASVRAPRSEPKPAERMPASVRARVHECAERAQLLATQLRGAAVSRDEAARALVAELGAVAREGARAGSSIGPFAQALRGVVEELTGARGIDLGVQFDVLLLDDEAERRGRVALAVESLGHVARAVTSLTELAVSAAQRLPDAIFVATDAWTAGPPELCTLLREVVRSETVPVVLYAEASVERVGELARETGAQHAFAAELEIEAIVAQLEDVFGLLLL